MSTDLEWLDGDGAAPGSDDELPHARRDPLRRRTKVLAGALGAIALAALVVVGVTSGDETSPRPAVPTVTATVAPSGGATAVFRPNGPPAAALAAIRAEFPEATVDSFVSVQAKVGEDRPTQIFNLRTSSRRVTVTVSSRRATDVDVVFRTSKSVRIGQQLGDSAYVDVTVTATGGPTSQRDFAAMQALVQDGRLLARR